MKNEPISYKFYKFSLLTFLMMMSALNYNLFINPAKIVAGGVNGISIIIEKILAITPSLTILTISISVLIIAFVLSEYELVVTAIYASIVYPIFVQFTSNIYNIIEIKSTEIIVIAIFSGIISGIISGLTCKLNMSQGGIILISQLIQKKFKIPVAKLNTLISFIIVLCGGFVFGMNSILYAIVFLTSNKIAMEKVMLGISQKKLFQVITSKEDDVKKYITDVLNIGYTTFNVKGAYESKKKVVIMTSIATRDYFKLKEGIKKIDSNSFILITDAYESQGGK